MRTKIVGGKPDRQIHVIRNADVLVIPRGSPVALSISTPVADILDGLKVALPSTVGATTAQFYYGIATTTLQPGDDGESVMFGITTGIVQKLTRAASTASWPSAASVAKGIVKIDTTNNIFIPGAASDGLAFILLDDAPAVAGTVSAAGDQRLTQSVGARIFVRALGN